MQIEKYSLVRLDNTELDEVYDSFDEAKNAARQVATDAEPIAIIALVFEFSDSELVWDSYNGADTQIWPPEDH